MFDKGYVHLYTGNGKGKTTAAIGLVVRAAGTGMHVLFLQFMKNGRFGEIAAFESLSGNITAEQYGSASFYTPPDSSYIEHRGFAKKGYDRAFAAVRSGEYQLVILDEIINALSLNLLTYDEVLSLISQKAGPVELVLTGRNAPTDLYEHCSLVTDMPEIKHYYSSGINARDGIEM